MWSTNRAQAGRGVAVYLENTKTGRRQAVVVESSEVADILVAWRDGTSRAGVERRGAAFSRTGSVAQGICAGAAGRRSSGWQRPRLAFFVALLPPRRRLSGVFANKPMSDILLRGRWKAESSGRHYVQAGRQMLIGSALPMLIARIAQRIGNLGLAALLGPDLAARLDG